MRNNMCFDALSERQAAAPTYQAPKSLDNGDAKRF
jgi:hypothetical protein